MKIPIQAGRVEQKQIADELYLYGDDGAGLSVLNETARRVWELCDGRHTLQDICSALHDEYPDIDEKDIVRDVKDCLADLHDKGLIKDAE